jgi:N-terminal acetyltransferase B complex non-catalytic subunit
LILSWATLNDLRRLINVHKLLRHDLSNSQLTVEKESARAALYINHYFEGLKLGSDLPAAELQPADDLAILAGNVFVSRPRMKITCVMLWRSWSLH